MRLNLRTAALLTASAAILSADVTYQQSTKFKGGALIDMMQKMASMPMMGRMMGGGKAFQDQNYDVYIKGNKMARIGANFSTIYDLDAGTVTQINHDRQSYTVQTFDEMRERMQMMQQRMNRGGDSGGEIQFDVKVTKTDNTQQVDGETAKEEIITLTAKQATKEGQMVVTVHAWMVPFNALRREAQDFHKRMAEKLTEGMASGGPMMGSANAGLAAAIREMAKLDSGYPAIAESVITGVTSAGGPMAAMGGGGDIDPNKALIDTETSNHNFSKGVADDTKFSVPPGYKQEQPRRMRGQ